MRGINNVHVIAVVKNLNFSNPMSKTVPEKGKKLLGEMKLGDMKSITSLKNSKLTENFTPSVCKFWFICMLSQ